MPATEDLQETRIGIETAKDPNAFPHVFSQAVTSNESNFIFVSGHIGLDTNGKLVSGGAASEAVS